LVGLENVKSEVKKERRRNSDRRVARYVPDAQRLNAIRGEDRRRSGDRRPTSFRRWRRVRIGGLPVVVVDRKTSARVMVDESLKRTGLWRYPAYLTSTNGEVTHLCALDEATRALFMQADAIHADGMVHVFVSHLLCKVALPERVATSDLFFDVCEEAERRGATMFMLGAAEEVNKAAAEFARRRYPALKLIGRRNGYFASVEEEQQACAEIARLGPDILWVSMGVTREQLFVVRNRPRLTSVGIVKTSGGLLDMVSGKRPRAPIWMQAAGFEWLWRLCVEPKRLGWRYLKTNPTALFMLLTRSG
jgi:N-acetylglucosaminyldiphosphoundecaprenol N-acetyl-beta-D-mannosaminyltransferase